MLENLWGVICFCSKRMRDTARPKVNPEDRFSALTATIPNKYLNEIALGMRQKTWTKLNICIPLGLVWSKIATAVPKLRV